MDRQIEKQVDAWTGKKEQVLFVVTQPPSGPWCQCELMGYGDARNGGGWGCWE